MADVPKTADIVIIGGGVHGASLAYHFARKKAGRVVLIEKKFTASGPTGRSTALVRRFYAMDFFTRTASAAAEMFRHWKDVVGGDGDPGFQQVGMLVLAGPDTAPYLRHNALRARELGAGVALLSPAGRVRRAPGGGRHGPGDLHASRARRSHDPRRALLRRSRGRRSLQRGRRPRRDRAQRRADRAPLPGDGARPGDGRLLRTLRRDAGPSPGARPDSGVRGALRRLRLERTRLQALAVHRRHPLG